MPSSLGPAEILVILIVALIVLGPNKLPQAGRQVGRALAEVRRWSQDVKQEVSHAFEPEPPRAPVVVRDPDPTLYSSHEVIPPATADAEVAGARPGSEASQPGATEAGAEEAGDGTAGDGAPAAEAPSDDRP